MEEDIELLKEFVEAIGEEYEIVRERQALEKLIKGYRALGEDYNHRCQLAIDRKIELENSVPKSKIKEIRDKAEVMDYYTLPDVIDDLNKLLEEE